MRKNIQMILSLAAAMVIVVSAAAAINYVARTRAMELLKPRASLAQMLASHPTFEKVFSVSRNGVVFYKVIGKNPYNSVALPSGPPAYIYGSDGKLVEWVYDIGENQAFREKWWTPVDIPALSKQEVEDLVSRLR